MQGIDLTLYRVVQEGLTNAVKHGDGSGARVEMTFTDDRVRVVIENGGMRADPAVIGAGRGLSGLRARVEQHHGTLDAGPSGSGYRLVCELPGPSHGEPAQETPTIAATTRMP